MKRTFGLALTIAVLAWLSGSDAPAQSKKIKDQVDKLVGALKSEKDPMKRVQAAQELQRIAEVRAKDGKPATEALVNAFRKDADGNVRVAAGSALRYLEADPTLVLPAVLDTLKNYNNEGNGVLAIAAFLAAEFGKEAKDAGPFLAEIKKREEAKEEKARDGNLINAVNTALQYVNKQ